MKADAHRYIVVFRKWKDNILMGKIIVEKNEKSS